ncbi:MAG: carboxypeptidase regulatory-like domain-containing protein [SAR202 cluster bacterium]|nr:carboxypeptidase regulatory-like domain-containing protein [SAR202 cluster bacterium]
MVESKIRCTTCYNVFNTTKDVGGKATCPMCDSAVAINENNIVGDIKKQISDLTGKIGSEVKRAITGKNKEEPTLTIDGKKYDRELMNLVMAITKDRNEINLKDTKKIFPKISDYNDYTKIEKQTVAYIRKKYKFTSEANKWLRTEIRREASTRVKDKKSKDPTNNEFKDDTPIKMVFTNIKDAYTWENINNLSEKPKSNAQWAGILLSIVFVLGLLSGVMYGLKWNNQEDQWDNNGLSSVHGSVIDEDGNAMEGVAVYGGNKQTTTNNQGQYYLYDLQGEEISILFSIEGYKDVSVWMDIRSGSANILEVEVEKGDGDIKLDLRKQIAEPWPPNYALAPIFMISALITLMGSAAALLQENFKIAITGCLFGIISYGFLIGSILSVVALALLLIDYQKFNSK